MSVKMKTHFGVYGQVLNTVTSELSNTWVVCTCESLDIANEMTSSLIQAWNYFEHAFLNGQRKTLGYDSGENVFDLDTFVELAANHEEYNENMTVEYFVEPINHMVWENNS